MIVIPPPRPDPRDLCDLCTREEPCTCEADGTGCQCSCGDCMHPDPII